MYNYLFKFSVVLLFISCNNSPKKIETTTMVFHNYIIDYNNLKFKRPVVKTFEFTNTGEHPLLISEVKTSCGCTVPEWPKEKFKPGEQGEIKVSYDAKHPGRFHKTITVFYNGKDSPKELTIKGEVAYPKE